MISSSPGDVKTGHRRRRKNGEKNKPANGRCGGKKRQNKNADGRCGGKNDKKDPGGGTYHPAGAQILIRLRAMLPRRGNARSVGHKHNRSAQVGSVHLRVNFLKAF